MLSITNIAKNKIKQLINNNGKALYLYLNSGGCNGFEYKFEILQENKKPYKLDEKINIDNEFDLYICNKSLLYVIGTKIDYIELYNSTSLKKPRNKKDNFRIFIAFYLNKTRLIDNI